MYDTHIANNCNMLLDDSEDSEQNEFVDTDISDVEVNEKEDETRNVSDNEDIHDFVPTMADEARRKYMYRKTNEVKETLEKLSCLDIEDQVKVLRRSMEVTTPRVVENLLMSDLDSVYQAKTAEGILQHLKNSPKMPKAQLCSMLYNIYGDELFEDELMDWVSKRINRRKQRVHEAMSKWITSNGDIKENRGRGGFSNEEKQVIYNTWNQNSIITVDRRNGRDQVNVRVNDFVSRYNDIVETEPMVFTKNKRGVEIVQSTKKIATKTVREIKFIVGQAFGKKISPLDQ